MNEFPYTPLCQYDARYDLTAYKLALYPKLCCNSFVYNDVYNSSNITSEWKPPTSLIERTHRSRPFAIVCYQLFRNANTFHHKINCLSRYFYYTVNFTDTFSPCVLTTIFTNSYWFIGLFTIHTYPILTFVCFRSSSSAILYVRILIINLLPVKIFISRSGI